MQASLGLYRRLPAIASKMLRPYGVGLTLASDQNTMHTMASLAAHGIICLSTIDWDFLWQRQQELMTRFARAGVPVLYVEPLGIRSARLSDAGKIARRVRRWVGQGLHSLAPLPVQQAAPLLFRLSPLALPIQGNRAADALNGRLVAGAIGGAARRMGLHSPILWTYYATRTIHSIASALRPVVIVYDCIDDVARNPKGVVGDYAASERLLLRQADLVFTTSSFLYADKRPFNPHTYLVPPGANAEHFAAPAPEPAEVAALPHPRLCFFGGIDERLDLAMLAALARSRPNWRIILLGVIRTDVSLLAGLHNIVFIGQKPYQDVPAYVQHMDVLLLPYLVNDYTQRIYPAKVFECLATGKPVLATGLADLAPLAGLLHILGPQDDPTAAIEQMLAGDSPQLADRRREAARANTWDSRLAEMQALLEQALPGKGRRS